MNESMMRRTLVTLVLTLSAAGCAAPASPTPPAVAPTPPAVAPTPATSQTNSGNLTQVKVVMGYIPNIQFAPFFVADQKGYFAAAGIKVNYNWGFELDGIKLVGANQSDFALLGGDQVIQARSQDIPLVYVANWYDAFPIAIFSLKDKNITKPQDLVGKKVGLPAYSGATYVGWRALLYGAGIKEADVNTQNVGYGQVAAVTQGVVDAAAGYSNNEPIQLALAGEPINVIQVSDYSKLVGIGLVTNEKTVSERPELVRAMVGALLRGVQDSISNPDEALNISLQSLPEAGGSSLKTTQAVLNASINLWTSSHLGYSDPNAWSESAKFMKDAGFIKSDVDVSKIYTNAFLPSPK